MMQVMKSEYRGKLKGVKIMDGILKNMVLHRSRLIQSSETPLHIVFKESPSAYERGYRATGSELVGLVPLQAMLDAGKYFLNKQRLSSGVSG